MADLCEKRDWKKGKWHGETVDGQGCCGHKVETVGRE